MLYAGQILQAAGYDSLPGKHASQAALIVDKGMDGRLWKEFAPQGSDPLGTAEGGEPIVHQGDAGFIEIDHSAVPGGRSIGVFMDESLDNSQDEDFEIQKE